MRRQDSLLPSGSRRALNCFPSQQLARQRLVTLFAEKLRPALDLLQCDEKADPPGIIQAASPVQIQEHCIICAERGFCWHMRLQKQALGTLVTCKRPQCIMDGNGVLFFRGDCFISGLCLPCHNVIQPMF